MNLVINDYRINERTGMKVLRIAEDDSRNRYSFINDYTSNDFEDLEKIVNNENISVDCKIELCYSKLNSSIFDIFRIIADYNSLYIINGEGLIIHICMLLSKFYSFEYEENKNILSFTNSLNISSVIYYIEKVLSEFSLCNANFHIIFFNLFKIFFEKETQLFENYNLIRNVFIIHCKKNLIPYFIFDNWYNDDNYNIYLIKYKPLFMVVEDSSSFLYAFNKFYVSSTENDETLNAVTLKTTLVDNITSPVTADCDDVKRLEKEKNYKEYVRKKKIYDYYNEEIRELSICFYFLIINNILRDIKCVFLFNFESEKNTVNAFSINYKGINFRSVQKLNDESAVLFDTIFYGKNRGEEVKNRKANDDHLNNMLIISEDTKDYDLLYKDEGNIKEEEYRIRDIFLEEAKSDVIYLKNIVLKLFYEKNKANISLLDDKGKKYFFLILKLLLLHNYLIEKLNMKNLCLFDSQNMNGDIYNDGDDNILKMLKLFTEPHVIMYLDTYNFILRMLQIELYCDVLRNVRNTDFLNFFNASIVHNLLSFICFKLCKNIFTIDHEDFFFEDRDFFEKSFQKVSYDNLCFFPIDFSFLKDDINNIRKGRLTNIFNKCDEVSDINKNKEDITKVVEPSKEKSDEKNKTVNDKNTSGNNLNILNVNLVKIKNEFIETFFSIKDVVNNSNLDEDKKMYVKVNFINKCVEYDSEFFELLRMLHISERENVMDIFRSYINPSLYYRESESNTQVNEKYKVRNRQRGERRMAIIAKYFYISSLHHPIVISENHPWLKYYSYIVENLYDYLRDEKVKKGINARMKKMFDNSSDEEISSKDEKKQINYSRFNMFQIMDDIDEVSEINSELKCEKLNSKQDNKKICNDKGGRKIIKGSTNSVSRKDEILKRKEMSNEKKTYEVDLTRYNTLETKINKLSSDNDYAEMNTWSLDIISGFNRLVDVYNFNNVTNLIKNVDLQIKISMKVLSSMFDILMYTKLKNVKSSKQKSDAIKSVMLTYKLTNEIFSKFKENLTEKDVVQLQTVLLSLGFKNSSYNLFEEYVKIRMKIENDLKNDDGEKEKMSTNKKGKGKEKSKLKDVNKNKKGSAVASKNKGKKNNNVDGDNGDDSSANGSDKVNEFNLKNKGKEIKEIYKYKIKEVKAYSELKIDENKEHEFQLYYMYYLLDRTTGNIKDKRVLFTLDTWQYNILNLVDKRKSILVSCPTSSGKTFICYYVMDKVLRLNNDSVVVYVAPNDALALQVYHEVNGRFSTKGYSKHGDNKLCSNMSDKYADNNALDAQIIIILPSVLENILLSYYSLNYPNERSFVSRFISRIEYIIFDEIHCIGDKEFYGTQIENIIHLTNCPFLALSATIGNINFFYSWLQNVLIKKGKGDKELHLIKFYERFSDLILYVYTNRNLHHLNPLACFNFRDILYKGINKDFYCNPREIYEIVILLFELARKNKFYDLVEFLEPSFYFQYTRCINKKQFIYYMHSVKEMIVYLIQNKFITNSDYDMFKHFLLSNYMKNADYVKDENAVVEEVGNEMIKKEDNEAMEKKVQQNGVNSTKNLYKKEIKENTLKQQLYQELYKRVVLDEKYFLNKSNDLVKYTEIVNMEQEYLDSDKLIELLKKLENVKFLPCIVFNFERKELEDMTINLIKELMRRQHDKYYGDEEKAFNTKMENKLRRERYESLLKQREMLLKIKTVSRNQRLEQNLDKDYLDMLNEDEIPEPPVDISEEYDGDFYFCNRKIYHNYVFEIEDLIKDAERALEGRKHKSVLIEGLKRGIGLHYEVLPYKFTIIVESLFRLGYVRIIFSNKNLSLGINIPCKSIIFSGHTFELNSVMFKQTSGRAGRRGFDLYGNVIIWNINFKNLRRLTTSPLQTLSGSYSVNFTNICRSMLLYNCLKKNREMEEFSSRNKVIVNKPNRKKKKDDTMTVAEKEELFEKNRSVNVNFFSRINGILSMFYSSLYYVNVFQHNLHNNKRNDLFEETSRRNMKELKNDIMNENKVLNEKKLNGMISMDTCASDLIVDNENVIVNEEKMEYIEYLANEFNQFKGKNVLSKFINRKYEYNELICEFIAKKIKSDANEKNISEICFMIKMHFLMYINILIEMEFLDEECNIINLTELTIFLKKEYDNNLVLTYLLMKKVLHNIIGDSTFLSSNVNSISLPKIVDSITFEKNYSRNIIVDDTSRGQFILLFILSHFVNRLKENKIALTNVLINYNCTTRTKLELFSYKYFPLLHMLPAPIHKHIRYFETIVLRYMINYSLIILTKLNLLNRKKTYLLPYTHLYIFEQHPSLSLTEIFPKEMNSEYFKFYQSKVHDYNIRSPFLASLYKYDRFENLNELLYTSLHDLDIRRNTIPDISDDYISFYKFDNGLIKEEKVCLKNSYILDYYIHGRYHILRSKNKLGQYIWYILDRFIQSLKNIEQFIYEVKKEKLLLSSDVFYTCLKTLKEVLEKCFKSINSDSVDENS
ncbi:DEAD/DEAH box helicase, putative [Plasmodium malariae]|uniref:DEAD/DEAH box helicase, putative n=1 Tax=Plasmodium malariae TaxID=5858 RepID=A0A1C3KB75_PLAMA|nr:DEAD/DEAH box helicase, putative [Plasmodium malariae]